MSHNIDLDFIQSLKQVKAASLDQQIGELEVRIGEARLEGNLDKVQILAEERNKVLIEKNPGVCLVVQYPQELEEAAYQGLVGEIIRAIEPNCEADPIALLMNLLTAFGNVIGYGAFFKVGADIHYLKIFFVLVGDTSKGRKGTSWNPIRILYDSVDPEWVSDRIQTGLSSGEGIIWHTRDPIFKTVQDNSTGIKNESVLDPGINDKRLFVLEGEFAQTLKVLSRNGNTLSPVIRNAWDSGNLQLLTKNTPAKSTGAHISIAGHITREELLRGLGEIETGNGFANRFLWFSVKRSKQLPFGGNYNSIDHNSLINRLIKAVEFAKTAGEIKWASETRPLWEAIYSELSEGRPGMLGAITARAEAQVTRLACIYALFDCSAEIRPCHLKAALAIWTYCENSVKYIFQNSEADPLANKILESLISLPKGMSRTDINRLLGGNYSSSRITEALDKLKNSNMAYMKPIETQGRPEERWFFIKM